MFPHSTSVVFLQNNLLLIDTYNSTSTYYFLNSDLLEWNAACREMFYRSEIAEIRQIRT